MLKIIDPAELHSQTHWLNRVIAKTNLCRKTTTGLAVRDFRVTVPNSRGVSHTAATQELISLLQTFEDRISQMQPVNVTGVIIDAPEGAAAIIRIITAQDPIGYFPECIHTAVFSVFETTVTVMQNHVKYRASRIIEMIAGKACEGEAI